MLRKEKATSPTLRVTASQLAVGILQAFNEPLTSDNGIELAAEPCSHPEKRDEATGLLLVQRTRQEGCQ